MKIVSYYTPQYKEIADTYLIPSLNKFDLDYEIDAVPSLGSWKKNTDYKPKILLDKLQKYDIIVYIDVDAKILKYPELLFKIDKLALHELNWNIHYGYNANPPELELLSGTMVLTQNDIPLVKKWIELASSFNWEQQALQYIIRKKKIDFYNLPSEYCTVITKDNKIPAYIKEKNVVILHNQKSRELKRKII